MTREGAVEVNAATGKKKRISKRIRDADFAKTEAPPQPEQAAQPLPGGATSPPLTDTPPLPHAPGAEREQDTAAAERVLERIDGARTRKASKKAARKAQAEATAKEKSSRLQFTDEERATPELERYIRKSDKAADRLDAAKAAIPKEKKLVRERTFDEATGKGKTRLHFEEQEKPIGKNKPHNNPLSRPAQEAGIFVHNKIHSVEKDNSGVEGAHKSEELAERGAKYGARKVKEGYWLYPTVRSEEDYGYYLIDELDELELPEEAKKYFKYEEYGRDAVSKDKGQFTEQGYIYNNQNTFTEWYRGTENEIPKEYRVMSFPQPERGGQDKTFMDAAATEQTARTAAEQPQEPHPVIPIVLTAGKPAEKLKEITDRLEQGITELFDSERYKEYLKVMSKFHNYSFRNTVLIAMQKPDASLLAGFSAWKNNFERNVMRGQKGIKIIAPSPYKIKQEMQKIDPHTQKPIIGKDGKPVTEEKEITIPAYKVVSVFDVSQTEGKELPDIAVDELTGDVDRYKDFFAALEKTSPVPIAFENIEGGSHGYYHLEDKRIAINEGMSELQTLKTAIHEIAHAKLHDIDLNAPKDEQPRVDRRTREVEAESVAYTVCQHYGLDTSDYSFGYVAGWSSGRELSELKSSLETIRSAAAEIINSIDANFAELQKAQDKEQTAGQEQPTREGQEAAPQPEAPKKADTAGKEKPEAAPKEAFTPETIYRVRRNPYSDSRENSHLLQAYVTQENGRAKMGDVLYTGTPEKCRELMGQLKSGELTEGDVKQLYAKAQETAQTTGQDKDTFSIYQIKGGDETRDFRFEPYDRLQAAGNVVDKANYELVYSAPLAPETSLEDIYTRFNIDHPKDFKGHSLSVSDVVVLHQNGQDTAHYVDSVGFRQVPEFLQEQKQLTPDELTTGETIQTPRGTFHVTAMSREQIEAAGYGFHHQSDDGKYLIMGNGTRAFAVAAEQPEKANPLKHIEDTVEQNDNNFDGIINNTPTVDELEAKVKAGETISLVDLANAVKADKERGKEAKPEKKPSIRAQLRADKEKAQKKNAKQKLQDLERS